MGDLVVTNVEDDMHIKEGDYVVFDEHGEKKSLVVIKSNGHAKVGKSYINTGDLIGAAWGSSYTLLPGGGGLTPVTEHEPVSGPSIDEVDKDNRDLVDANTSQALTADDIRDMKAAGKGGEEIVEALCKHSTTFKAKTEFAQDKYKRRKARKYATRLTLRRPTGWTVCQVLFDKAPNAVWNLRPDSLSLLLSLANVGAGSRCLVLENCQGLVSGAVAERLGGVGSMCCVGTGGKPAPLSLLHQMNLGPQQKGVVAATQLSDLLAAAQRCRQAAAAAAGDTAGQQQQQPGRAEGTQQQEPQQQEPPAQSGQVQQDAVQQQGDSTTQQGKQQQQQQAEGNGKSPQQQHTPSGPTPAAASPAAEAAAGPVDGHVAGSIPVVACAAVVEEEVELDSLYDSSGADTGARKRLRGDNGAPVDAAAAAAAAAGSQHKRRKQQLEQQQEQAGGASSLPVTGQDTAMADAVEGEAAGAAAGPQHAAANGAAAGRPVREGRVQHLSAPEDIDKLLAAGFNSCIIAAPKLDAKSIITQVLPLLAPSSAFVLFSPWSQPLAEAMASLTASKGAVTLQLQESWLRPYQVLPGRTHPHMALTTGGTGGYILSGITVLRDTEQDAGASKARRGGGQGRRGGKGRGSHMRR